ncbi:phytase [Paenibacillus kribbensis]|uniref:phytase n=1 Tax=Paenibacillus kribbensis TaxID=172713 RepID=UPI000837E648|nr:phytase [Paenibacillus kribbensis]
MKATKLALLTMLTAILISPEMTRAAEVQPTGYEPLRTQADKIGAVITWDNDDKSAAVKLKNGIVGTFTVGEKQYRLAGQTGEADHEIKLVDGNIYLPTKLLATLKTENSKYADPKDAVPTYKVTPSAETEAVEDGDDAADDPAIWLNPANPENSRIVATNKGGGILVYDLEGKQLQNFKVGKMNNVDIRYGFKLGDKTIDIAGATNRTNNTVDIFAIDGVSGTLTNVVDKPTIQSSMKEVYGFSLYHSLKTGKFYALVLGKEGEFEQYELTDNGNGKIAGKLVRQFKLATQSEGMVADDEYGTVYIAEEDHAIWKYDAEPDGSSKPLRRVDIADGRRLQDDIEGLTLYYGKDGKGYLMASSQGNSSYAIYERQSDNAYISNFKISASPTVDGTSFTDGIDVLGYGLGKNFPHGIFVAQDDENLQNGKKLNQNFKMVPWEQIAKGARIPLTIDDGINPRELVNRSTR